MPNDAAYVYSQGKIGSDRRTGKRARLNHNGHDDRNRARSSCSGTEAFADDPGIGEKNDVPKNRRHAEIAILEAMVGEVPQLC